MQIICKTSLHCLAHFTRCNVLGRTYSFLSLSHSSGHSKLENSLMILGFTSTWSKDDFVPFFLAWLKKVLCHYSTWQLIYVYAKGLRRFCFLILLPNALGALNSAYFSCVRQFRVNASAFCLGKNTSKLLIKSIFAYLGNHYLFSGLWDKSGKSNGKKNFNIQIYSLVQFHTGNFTFYKLKMKPWHCRNQCTFLP